MATELNASDLENLSDFLDELGVTLKGNGIDLTTMTVEINGVGVVIRTNEDGLVADFSS